MDIEKNINDSGGRFAEAFKATYIGLAVNIALVVAKLAAGLLGRSGAIVADAVHSLSDSITDLFVIISLKIARKPPDEGHDYGHGKIEALCAMIIGLVLAGIGAKILWNGLSLSVRAFFGEILEKPGWIAFAAAVFSIVAKELLFRYTAKIGKRIGSGAVIANAWHHRSDSFSSIGVAIGISGAILFGEKWRILDPIAALIVSFFIIGAAVSIVKSAVGELMDESLDGDLEKEIVEIARSVEGADNPHDLKTRKIGHIVSIDMHIHVSRDISIVEAHDICTEIENALKMRFGFDSFVIVHCEPFAETCAFDEIVPKIDGK